MSAKCRLTQLTSLFRRITFHWMTIDEPVKRIRSYGWELALPHKFSKQHWTVFLDQCRSLAKRKHIVLWHITVHATLWRRSRSGIKRHHFWRIIFLASAKKAVLATPTGKKTFALLLGKVMRQRSQVMHFKCSNAEKCYSSNAKNYSSNDRYTIAIDFFASFGFLAKSGFVICFCSLSILSV